MLALLHLTALVLLCGRPTKGEAVRWQPDADAGALRTHVAWMWKVHDCFTG